MSACVGVDVFIGTVYSIPPLLSSSLPDSPQSDDSVLSQKVYGELVVLMSLVRNTVRDMENFFRRLPRGLSANCLRGVPR